MTLAEIVEQVKTLNAAERDELLNLLLDMEANTAETTTPKTGAEIAAILNEMEPIEFVDPQLVDPVEWVKAQRRKRAEKLKPYRDGDQ